MTMRTPLSRVRGLGSAKDGTEHFWLQRLTAVALVPLVLYFIVLILSLTSAPYEVAVHRIGAPLNAVLLLAMILAGTVHMRLGMQVIIEDYVHGAVAKTVLLLGNTFFAALIAISSVLGIAKIAFGH